MSSGTNAKSGTTEQQPPAQNDDTKGLAEYIDQKREDLEALAEGDYPISHPLQVLLDRRDRGDI